MGIKWPYFVQKLLRRKSFASSKTLALGFLLMVLMVGFQNCGKVRITEDSASLLEAQDRKTDVEFKDVVILTEVNQNKTLNLIDVATFKGTVSFEDGSLVAEKVFEKQGTITLTSTAGVQITFTPVFGYRGSVSLPVYIKYSDKKVEIIKLTFQVQNPLRDFKPSLVARAAECMLCHATLKGDLISDLGFKGPLEPNGLDLFFRNNPNVGGGTWAYSAGHSPDAAANTGWGSFKTSGKVIVPAANLDTLPEQEKRLYVVSRSYVENSVTKVAGTLKEYLDKVFFADKTRLASLQERKTIYIGAPTADEIRASGRISTSKRLNFVKNNDDSKGDLTGFEHVTADGKDYFTNTAEVVCDGDIFVDGVVFLNNLSLKTELGCRIHATQTVFIQGPIEYLDEYALSNLQVMSAKAIYMGIGMCFNCYNNDGLMNRNFVVERAVNVAFWVGALRNKPDLSGYSADMRADFLKVSNESNIPTPAVGVDVTAYYDAALKAQGVKLLDANNPFNNTAATAYNRLLLNAPDVQSRYNGKFQGTVIAEFALWKLGGQFAFQYDSVFTAVPIFPLMDFNKILVIGEAN